MQTTEISQSALERRIDMSISLAEIEQSVAKRLKQLSRTVKMHGFRPGKVPMKIVEQTYGPQARSEAIGQLVEKTFGEKVREQKLRVAGYPRIEPKKDAASNEEMQFSAVFEVFPDVVPGNLSGKEIEKPALEVSEEDVARTLEVLRKQRVSYLVTTSRPSQTGDRVTIDFLGTKDGEAFEGGSAEDFQVIVGSGSMLAEFDAQLQAVNAGDTKNFDLTFPEDYHAKHLAGQRVQFKIDVKQVEEALLPELDADFARALGVADGDVVKMRDEVKSNLQREVKRRLQTQTKENVMSALLDVTPLDVPKSLVETESQHMADNARQDMAARGMKNVNELPISASWFADQATRRVKLGLILAEIVKINNLQAKPEQVRAMVEEFAHSYEDPSEVIRFYYAQPQRLSQVEALVTEENVVEWALQQAHVVEKPVGFDELMGNNPAVQ